MWTPAGPVSPATLALWATLGTLLQWTDASAYATLVARAGGAGGNPIISGASPRRRCPPHLPGPRDLVSWPLIEGLPTTLAPRACTPGTSATSPPTSVTLEERPSWQDTGSWLQGGASQGGQGQEGGRAGSPQHSPLSLRATSHKPPGRAWAQPRQLWRPHATPCRSWGPGAVPGKPT